MPIFRRKNRISIHLKTIVITRLDTPFLITAQQSKNNTPASSQDDGRQSLPAHMRAGPVPPPPFRGASRPLGVGPCKRLGLKISDPTGSGFKARRLPISEGGQQGDCLSLHAIDPQTFQPYGIVMSVGRMHQAHPLRGHGPPVSSYLRIGYASRRLHGPPLQGPLPHPLHSGGGIGPARARPAEGCGHLKLPPSIDRTHILITPAFAGENYRPAKQKQYSNHERIGILFCLVKPKNQSSA